MSDHSIEESKALLTSQSDEEGLQFPAATRQRKRDFSLLTWSRTLVVLYLIVLHIALSIALFQLYSQQLKYKDGQESGIYSKKSTHYITAYHGTKETQLQYPVQLALL